MSTYDAYDFVHLVLLAAGGRIQGKTKLQKTVYFFGKMTGLLENLGYEAHYYGPYSSDVAGATGRLVSLGFVEHRALPMGMIDSRGFEVARHDFSLSDDGKYVAEQKKKRYPELWKSIASVAPQLRGAAELDYVKLSIAAKTDFLLNKQGGNATVGELAAAAGRFGWTVEPSEVKVAAEFLEEIGLVTVTEGE